MKYLLSFVMTLFFIGICSINMQAQTATTDQKKSLNTAESTLTVKVKGVGCNTDIKMIQDQVKKLEGVNDCVVVKKGATTHFKVKYVSDKVNTEAIHAAIEDTPGCSNPKDRPYKVKL